MQGSANQQSYDIKKPIYENILDFVCYLGKGRVYNWEIHTCLKLISGCYVIIKYKI